MRTAAAVVLLAVLLLSPNVVARAQGTPAGNAALAVPVSGKIAIVNAGPANVQLFALVAVANLNTAQQYDLEVTLPVLGFPLQGETSLLMSTRAAGFVVISDSHSTGQARSAVLHGAAGDIPITLSVDQPTQGFGANDPAQAVMHIRGSGGTGMFEGVDLAGDLKGFFRPTGTLYLTYPSSEAALNAAQRGLAQNGSLTAAQRVEALAGTKQALAQATPSTFPPPEGPGQTQATVSASIQRTGTQAQLALRIIVPKGDPHQPVKVVAVGSSGPAQTVYQGVHAPGETVSVSVTGTPPFIVQVYVAGVLTKQVTVPAE